MATRELPDPSLLRQLLDYDPISGEFTWRHRPQEMFVDARIFRIWNTRYAGKKAGCKVGRYLRIGIHDSTHLAHRLAWLYHHGACVPKGIDHIDGDPLNNRISNLRAATQQQNSWNMRVQKHNKLGIKGVWRHRQKFRSQIKVNGKLVDLGRFTTVDEAAKAYRDAAVLYFGEFANPSQRGQS